MKTAISEEVFYNTMETNINERKSAASDALGGMMDIRLISACAAEWSYVLSAVPQRWMRNNNGTLHGGMCAALADQSMGYAAFSNLPGPGIAPTCQMQINYHRPVVMDGTPVSLRVRVVSATHTLIHITCQAWQGADEGRLCFSANATYFYLAEKNA